MSRISARFTPSVYFNKGGTGYGICFNKVLEYAFTVPGTLRATPTAGGGYPPVPTVCTVDFYGNKKDQARASTRSGLIRFSTSHTTSS